MQKKLSKLKFQKDNANKGTVFGDVLLEKSLQKFGFREAGTLDKNDKIVSGNHRTKKAGEIGIEDAIIIEADPTKAYYLKYNDIDLKTKEGKELAIALNAAAKANIAWEAVVIDAVIEEVDVREWGIDPKKITSTFKNTPSVYNEDEDEYGMEEAEVAEKKETNNSVFEVPFFINIPKSAMAEFEALRKQEKKDSKTMFINLVNYYKENYI